jgi:hypothetical protein
MLFCILQKSLRQKQIKTIRSGANATNVSRLLVLNSRLLNAKKLGNLKNWMP